MAWVKNKKDDPVLVGGMIVRAGVRSEATLVLGDTAGISITLIVPGLTGVAVQDLLSYIDGEGFLTLQVVGRDGEAKDKR